MLVLAIMILLPLASPYSSNLLMIVVMELSFVVSIIVSSANALHFCSLPPGILMPPISLSCLMFSSRGSKINVYSKGDMLHPCLTDHVNMNSSLSSWILNGMMIHYIIIMNTVTLEQTECNI